MGDATKLAFAVFLISCSSVGVAALEMVNTLFDILSSCVFVSQRGGRTMNAVRWMHLRNTGALEDLKDLGEPVPPRHVTLKTVHSDVYDQAAFLQKSKTPA
ncbi:hypothetical protein D9C73_000430 [Collichthys lucidus]|uniref:Uncharacterized protein n=1 Tax=Collichthys lucidus TaxID=240159 RepID=A0A4U5TXI2_COLLU|nr:hypothetical protein D9C73_000430 [Collichthys lucidus]